MGVLQYNNGDTYEGQFAGSQKEGVGVYSFSAGGKYEGSFKGDERNGVGTMVRED
jgi:hypothetical protein